MGLFSKIKKAAKKAIKVGAPIAAGGAAAYFGGPGVAAAAPFAPVMTRIPQILRGLPGRLPPTPPPVLPPRGGGGGGFRLPRVPPVLPFPTDLGFDLMGNGAGACPGGYHLAKDRSGRCVRNRRMNPLNPRAARRAIRRIKGAMKMLKQIERQLPKQRTRRAPAYHRTRVTHT